jgi:hypothetical protein
MSFFTKLHKKNSEGGEVGSGDRGGQEVDRPTDADPSLRELPIQECCHFTVGLCFRSVMLRKNIWSALK